MNPDPTTRTALRISTIEGVWATVHVVLTAGAFLTGYALYLGANDFQLAVISAIPLLAQLAQIPGAYLVERTGKRKLITGLGGLIGRVLWIPIALLPLMPGVNPIIGLMVIFGISSISMNLGGPAWVAWMVDLVPKQIRGRYFGNRNKIVGVVTVVGTLAAGYAMDVARGAGREYAGYVFLQLSASAAAIVAIFYLRRQYHPPYQPESLPSPIEYMRRPLADANYRRILAFYMYWLFAVGVSAPFFTAHLLKNLGWDFRGVAATAVCSAVLSIIFHPFWGRAIDRFGHKPVLMVTAVGILPLPLFYAFCPPEGIWPIFANAALAGLFWSGFNLAIFNLILSSAPEKGRPGFLACQAALSGVVNFIASLLGGVAAVWLSRSEHHLFGLEMANYQVIFAAGALMRVPGILLLHRIREPNAKRTVLLVRQMFSEIDRRLGFGRQVVTVPVGDEEEI